MGVPSRNTPCPCGSGLKYKRCCLAAEYGEREAARFEDAVGKRISSWVAIQFPDELDAALEHFAGADRGLDDRDVLIFLRGSARIASSPGAARRPSATRRAQTWTSASGTWLDGSPKRA